MWSCFRMPHTSLVVAFCSFWSRSKVSSEIPKRRLLQKSMRDRIKHVTRGLRASFESCAPRLRTIGDDRMVSLQIYMLSKDSLSSCWRLPNVMNSVLSILMFMTLAGYNTTFHCYYFYCKLFLQTYICLSGYLLLPFISEVYSNRNLSKKNHVLSYILKPTNISMKFWNTSRIQ